MPEANPMSVFSLSKWRGSLVRMPWRHGFCAILTRSPRHSYKTVSKIRIKQDFLTKKTNTLNTSPNSLASQCLKEFQRVRCLQNTSPSPHIVVLKEITANLRIFNFSIFRHCHSHRHSKNFVSLCLCVPFNKTLL